MAKGKYEYWLTHEGLLLLEGWARDGLTDEQIADNMDVNVATLYRYKNAYCEICEAIKKGKEVADYEVENALFKKATGYKIVETVRERIIDSGQKKRHNGQQELTEIDWDMAIKYFGGRCCYCDDFMSTPTKDHIIPLSLGGRLEVTNVVPCCGKCNSSKKDSDMEEWYKRQVFFTEARLQKIKDYIQFAKEFNFGEDLVITKEVTKEMPPDVTAQIFWLKNRRPDKWRDRPEAESKPNDSFNEGMQTLADLINNPAPNRNIADFEGDGDD